MAHAPCTYGTDLADVLRLGQGLVDDSVVLAGGRVEHQLGRVDGVGALGSVGRPLGRRHDVVLQVLQLELAQLLGEVDGARSAGADGGELLGVQGGGARRHSLEGWDRKSSA